MAAVLTGAAVIVLGHALGLGIRVPEAMTVMPPPAQPAAPSAPAAVPEAAVPGMTMPEMPAMRMGGMGHAPSGPTQPEPTGPTDPGTPEPTPEPDEPIGTTCAPALLEALPVVGTATAPVADLLSSVLASTPVVKDLAAPPRPGRKHGLLTCVVGSLVGPNCCGPAVQRRGDKSR